MRKQCPQSKTQIKTIEEKLIIMYLSYNTYLFLLFIKIIDDHTNEQVECEKWAKDDEEHKVQIHVDVGFFDWLLE
jgi:hypothetical protein